MSANSIAGKSWKSSDWRKSNQQSDKEDIVNDLEEGENVSKNYKDALGKTLDRDRLHQKKEAGQVYKRIREEVDLIQNNFKIIEEILREIQENQKGIQETQKEIKETQKEQDKKLSKIISKVNRSSGFFSNICRSIPGVSTVFSVVDAAKDAYDSLPSFDPNLSTLGNMGKSVKAIGGNVWGSITSFFN